MGRERGLIKEIAYKRFGGDVRKAKHELMSVAVKAAKRLIRAAGIRDHPGLAWFVAMKVVMKPFWEVVKEKKDVPTVEEVLSKLYGPRWNEIIALIWRAYEISRSLGVA